MGKITGGRHSLIATLPPVAPAARGLLTFRPLLALLLMLMCATAANATVVINFELPNVPGNGTRGLAVGNQYASQGIIFNTPTALDYSQGAPTIPGFAHSGTKAVELCYGEEFCTTPLQMNFTAAQSRVKVWVGYSSELATRQTVVLRAFSTGGAQVGQATATLGPSPGPTPVATPLQVALTSAQIVRATVGFLGAEGATPSIHNNKLAIDDVEFETAGAPPVCPSVTPPTLVLSSPKDGQTLLQNIFNLSSYVSTGDPSAQMQLDVTGPAGQRKTFGPFYISAGQVSRNGLTA